MALGSAASELAVAKAIVTGSATAMKRRNGRRGNQRNRQQHHQHEDNQRGISVSRSLTRLTITPNPMVPTVYAMAPATPMGAKSMTMLVNLNIVSERLSQKTSMGRRLSSPIKRQRDTEDDAEDHDLEHLAFGHGLGDVLREDVQDESVHFCVAAPETVAAGSVRRRREPFTRALRCDGAQPDEQRDRRNDFKVQQCLDAHAANLFQVGVSGDADHQRAEDERRNDGLDQAEKNRTQHLQVSGDPHAGSTSRN